MMTPRILLATVLCLAPALVFGQSISASTEASSSSETRSLHDILSLTADQVAQIEQLGFEYDDARFLHFQEILNPVWRLNTALRLDEPNIGQIESLVKEVEEAIEEGRELAKEHRAKVRAVLTPRQNFALYSLEQALKLSAAANEAVEENMIEDPYDRPSMDDAFDFVRDGLFYIPPHE